jgi:transglutaminase-like putative cysteine protease
MRLLQPAVVSALALAALGGAAARPCAAQNVRPPLVIRPTAGDPAARPQPGRPAGPAPLLPMPRGGGFPPVVLAAAPAQRIAATLTLDVKAPNLTADEWVVYAPAAPELSGQVRTASVLAPGGKEFAELSPLARPVLGARLPVTDLKDQQRLTVQAGYQATLVARRLVPLVPGMRLPPVAPLPPAERLRALVSGDLMDYEARPFQKWLDAEGLRARPGEGELAFAHRVYLAIRAHFQYQYPALTRQASGVCLAGRSDCGGIAVLFVSALRANGVPARALAGWWVDGRTGTPSGAHVKAEFYALGVGWVPADPCSGMLFDRTPAGLQFFGNDPGDFLTVHVDTDLVLDSIHFGKQPAEFLQTPIFWVSGSGTLDGLTTQSAWQGRRAH